MLLHQLQVETKVLLGLSGSLSGPQLGDFGFCGKVFTHGNTNNALMTFCPLVLVLENKAFTENMVLKEGICSYL